VPAITTLDKATEGEVQSFGSPPVWWTVTQIVALAFHLPLLVVASEITTVNLQVTLLIALGISVGGILIFLILKVRLADPWRRLSITSALLVGFWHWSASETSGTTIRVVWLGLIVAAAARFADSRRFRIAAFAIAITLAVTPLLLIPIKYGGSQGGTESESGFGGFPGEPTVQPDIYFLLLDGYGNSDVLADIYGFDNEPFLAGLERRGFDVSRSATANYTYTHASVPSMLNMELLPAGLTDDPRHPFILAETIAGDNRVVSWLKDIGYTYIHGETAHGSNDCGPQVDLCLPSPFWDQTTEHLLGRTPVGRLLFPSHGNPSTAFNMTRIEQMSRWEEDWDTRSGEPTFTFLHLLLPHPPYFLDADCEVRLSDDLGGQRAERGLSAEIAAARRAAYIEQVECANRVVTQFIDQIGPDSMVILTGDHGPESFGQLTVDGSEWSDIEVYERSGVLAAIRGPAGCDLDLPDDHQLVNTFRIAFSCLTSSPITSLPHLVGS
jgi:hypothetical protein